MQLSRIHPVASAMFDDPNLGSSAGLVPVVALADGRLTAPGGKGSTAGVKLSSMVAGMVAGANNIDGMAVLRHGGTGKLFSAGCAPLHPGLVPAFVHLSTWMTRSSKYADTPSRKPHSATPGSVSPQTASAPMKTLS